MLVLKVTELMVEWSLRQKIFRVAEILFRLSAVDSVACEQLASRCQVAPVLLLYNAKAYVRRKSA